MKIGSLSLDSRVILAPMVPLSTLFPLLSDQTFALPIASKNHRTPEPE